MTSIWKWRYWNTGKLFFLNRLFSIQLKSNLKLLLQMVFNLTNTQCETKTWNKGHSYLIYLRYSLLANLWENYDSLPAKINNKIAQQLNKANSFFCIVEQTIPVPWKCVLKRLGVSSQIDEKDRVASNNWLKS